MSQDRYVEAQLELITRSQYEGASGFTTILNNQKILAEALLILLRRV